MNRFLGFLVLILSTTAQLCAQTNPSDKTFSVPDNIIIARKYDIKLDRGNHFKIELTAIEDLAVIANMDSLLALFLADISGLKDSEKK